MAQVGVIQLKPFCLVVKERDALCSWVGMTGLVESEMARYFAIKRKPGLRTRSEAEQRAPWINREPCTYHNENLSF